ncbi:MFS transporter, partial [Burkholderia multivorans]
SGPHRRTLASIGLIVAIIGFLVAAFAGSPGAAIAAVRNPNRVSATSGVVNRLLVMVVLALIPTIGLAQITVFGALALLAAISLAVTVWLPATPA